MSLTDIKNILVNSKKKNAEAVMVALATLADEAKKNCKQCYGRGYTSRHITTGKYIPCSCVRNKYKKEKNAKIRKQSR